MGVKQVARRCALMVLLGFSVHGCAHTSTVSDPYDPWEPTNRKSFAFNQSLDRYFLAPLASGWTFITPQFVRKGVDNFFTNARYPNVILNDFLQGKGKQGVADSTRFLINSTAGLLGVWDPASLMGLEPHNEDFGQTLAVWGANTGPYLEVPALGPYHTRDTADIPVVAVTNIINYAVDYQVSGPLLLLYYVNKRALLEKAAKIREEAALDPYIFTRTAYMQYREQLIYDGNPPQEDLYDESLFEDLED